MNSYLSGPLKLFFSIACRVTPALATRLAERLFTRVPYSKRRENENELLEAANQFTVTMKNGHRLAGYRWGKKTDPIILFVHGWTATATCFSRFIDHFVAQGYQVVSYDAVGHGHSTGKHTSLPEWADTVREVNAKIGHVHAIIGHSLGASSILIASFLSLDTNMIVLLSPATNAQKIFDQFALQLALSTNVRERFSVYLWEKYKFHAQKYANNWDEIFSMDYQQPTLVIHDRNDKEVHIDDSRWLAQRWPQAQFIETKRLGHRRILLSQKVISLVGEFIQKPAAEVRV